MKKLRIFIVEDDPFYAQIVKAKIEDIRDVDIEIFTSGQQMLASVYKLPDLILIDYNLEEEKGMEILQEVKMNHPNIMIVIMSGQDKVSVAVEALKLGAADYLIKGLDDTKDQFELLLNCCETKLTPTQNSKSFLKRVQNTIK